ncbi:amidase [Devosia sp. CN2-171]|uniref:amidase n=1 Tax=Devosia sp. CN2-171 TaxID=3400909 RepID=UPI003BF8EE62
MTDQPLHYRSAKELAQLVATGEISAVEVMRAFLARIEEANPKLNTIVSMLPASEALAHAEAADRSRASGDTLGVLHGLPIAIKDLNHVRGFPTSFGSRAHLDDPLADRDVAMVAKIRAAGALIIGKTNAPAYGVGTLTFNDVFGVTRNPWDTSKHAGGSSGGGAAVAAGLLPFADGGDSGGSIRYPPSFCNIVGLRTSPGRVPLEGFGDAWTPHVVLGPMARSSEDAGLLLAAMSGVSDISATSIDQDPSIFLRLADVDLSDIRIAWSKDAGGLPIDPEVRAGYARARETLERLGCKIEDVDFDLSTADRAWEVIEMFGFFMDAPKAAWEKPELLRPDYLRNIRQGAATPPEELAWGIRERTAIFLRMAALLRDYDVFVTPATPVTAPPAEVEWVSEIDGVNLDRYFKWQRMACRLTMTAHPILVTPGGFTDSGMPFGLQIVGPMRGEHRLLSLGNAIERATGWINRRPAGV